ncbi:DUF421 domain-containing protein [Radiobacillus kanasensis]|uniref:DUF421 domain-containing protein n=1 Tax=Radiobacillus kanasensis TaxID=2844358 RepID=UPI001E60D2C4|nr:DUF421 domain-containing protein [Radiobacillus kanasensis]UFU00288.1 DUF421 domain-containing protein [Radiobacillus kanasensis]
MDINLIWKSVLIVLVGTFLLRIAGRKTISQMTLAETVIMISIGNLLISPIAERSVLVSFVVGGLLVITLILMEYGQLKSDRLENLITGKSTMLIEKGQVIEKNIAKARMTVDQLEMNLRQKNVTKISDIQYATLEPNGQLGFILKQESQPVTKKDLDKLTRDVEQLKQILENIVPRGSKLTNLSQQMNPINHQLKQSDSKENVFSEVANKGHKEGIPKHLQ